MTETPTLEPMTRAWFENLLTMVDSEGRGIPGLTVEQAMAEIEPHLATQPQGREDMREKVLHLVGEASNTAWLAAAKDPSDIAANKSAERDAEIADAIMSLIPPAGLPVEASEEARRAARAASAKAHQEWLLRSDVLNHPDQRTGLQLIADKSVEAAYATDARPVKAKALEWATKGGQQLSHTAIGVYRITRGMAGFYCDFRVGSHDKWEALEGGEAQPNLQAAEYVGQEHFDTLVSQLVEGCDGFLQRCSQQPPFIATRTGLVPRVWPHAVSTKLGRASVRLAQMLRLHNDH